MTRVENKGVVREYFEAMERGDMEAAASHWAADAVNHGAGRPGQEPPRGPDGLRMVFGSIQAAFPDRRWTVEEIVADGDTVVARLTVSGTYGQIPPIPVEGAMFMATAPAGARYSVQHVHIFRLRDGKIIEHRALRDDLGLLTQLGVLTPVAGQRQSHPEEVPSSRASSART